MTPPGARTVCGCSTVRRTFLSRPRHSGPRRAPVTAYALCTETHPAQNRCTQHVIFPAQPYRVDGDPVSSQTASLTRRNAMQRHVDRLITRGRLLHTSGCSICKRIFALPLTEQRSLIANARPDYSEPGSKRPPPPPQ